MTIRFLGQSGYILESDGTRIVIEPYLSDIVNRVAGRPRLLPVPIAPRDLACDAVICTHDHLDHLDPDTVSELSEDQLFITTKGGKEKLASLGKENTAVLEVGESIKVGGIELTAVFAAHTVEAFGLIVKAEGKTLYFSGDTLFSEQLYKIKTFAPDTVFICINGKLGNMNVAEALTVARQIGAKVNIPNHYDMFASNSEDPHLFADSIMGGFIMEFNKVYSLT